MAACTEWQARTSVEEMAEYCRSELRARGIPPPYHLLAMSLGAMVAVAWAADHAQEIRGGVLINTSLRPFSPFYRRLRPRNYPALLKLAFLGGDDREWEQSILRLTSNHAATSMRTCSAPGSPIGANIRCQAATRYGNCSPRADIGRLPSSRRCAC